MRLRVLHICTAVACAAAPALAQDNVLILLADDIGVDNVTVYQEGTTPPPTPNIDALAGNGVLFRNAWSYPTCSPTRALIQTGRYGFRTGVGFPVAGFGFPPQFLQLDEHTLPEVLDAGSSGYAHAMIGKWHLGAVAGPGTPNVAGWSHFAGLLPGASNYYSWARTVDGVTTTSSTYITTQLVDDALSWIGTQSGPWVCYVSFTAPHTPFHAPPANLHTRNLSGAGDPKTNPRPYFEAMVEAMDTEIGRLLNGLGPALANTNVIFMGDNGSHQFTVLPPFIPWRAKARPYEGGVNVPLIVSGPAVASPGREEDAQVHAVDLFSTITELAGVNAASALPPWVTLDSVSMVPYFSNVGQAPLRQFVFAEEFFGLSYADLRQAGYVTIRDDQYKFIQRYSPWYTATQTMPVPYPQPINEFYDLQADPFEQNELLAGGLTPAQQQRYFAILAEFERIRWPQASFTPFGMASCVGSNGNPSISTIGRPALGRNYTVQLQSAPPLGAASLLVGGSSTTYNTFTLPLDLSQFGGGPGCFLYNSIGASIPTATDAAGAASLQFRIPNNQGLVGLDWFYSWAIDDLAAPNNSLGFTTSDAVAVIVGF